MSLQELERIKLNIHNNLSYEETDLLQDYIESIQTPEWTKRRKEKEERDKEETERDFMDEQRSDNDEERGVIDDDIGNDIS